MNRWDVYWADMPYEENPSQTKPRPVVIARDQVVYVLTLRVTSHAARQKDPYDYTLQFWQEAGLTKASVVRVSKLAKIKPEAIHERIGSIHPADAIAIQKLMLQRMQELHSSRTD